MKTTLEIVKEGVTEEQWRHFERIQLRKEVNRLFRKGFIRSAARVRPQRLEKDENGRWRPKLDIH